MALPFPFSPMSAHRWWKAPCSYSCPHFAATPGKVYRSWFNNSLQGVHCVLGAVLGANDISHCSLGTYPQVPTEVKEKEVNMKQNNPPPDPPFPYISIPTTLIRQPWTHANNSLPWEEKYLRTNMGFPLKWRWIMVYFSGTLSTHNITYVHLCWYTSMILSRKDMCGNFVYSKQVESRNIRGFFFIFESIFWNLEFPLYYSYFSFSFYTYCFSEGVY